MYDSLSGFFQKLELKAKHLPRAGHIPHKPPKKKSDFCDHISKVVMRFCNRTIFALIFLQEGQINSVPSPECCIFIAVSEDTHIEAI